MKKAYIRQYDARIKRLQKIRQKIPFLQLISDEVYFSLDPSEWIVPTGYIATLRQELEEKLGHYVMTYDRGVFRTDLPPEKHLCMNLKGAQLTNDQRKVLELYELKVRKLGVSFVVYQKPLQYNNRFNGYL